MKAWQWIREHWIGLLVLIACFIALNILPKGVVRGIGWTFLVLVLLLTVGVPLFDAYAEKRLCAFVKRHIESLGYTCVEVKKWHAHFGVTFLANGKKHYVRFEHGGWGKVVDWVDGPPEEAVAHKS
jgi:hypothetical protein